LLNKSITFLKNKIKSYLPQNFDVYGNVYIFKQLAYFYTFLITITMHYSMGEHMLVCSNIEWCCPFCHTVGGKSMDKIALLRVIVLDYLTNGPDG